MSDSLRPFIRHLIVDELRELTSTRWLLTRTAGLDRLRVEVVVDTTAPDVIAAIEDAAARAGIELERIPPESITCPICGRTSWHPEDVRQGWCGACHGVTSRPGRPGEPEPPPPGMRWVVFRGGELDRVGRLVDERHLEPGSTYELATSDERWIYDGAEYRLED